MSGVKSISGKSTGRRPAGDDTKGKIIAAAQDGFARAGYDRTSLRQIATAAGVDAALIVHYFGTKQQLFIKAMMPIFDGPKRLPNALDGDTETIGFRLATLFVEIMMNPSSQQLMLGIFRSVSSEEQAAEMLRSFIRQAIMERIKQYLPGPNKDLQANILGSQLIGIFVARYIVKVEPIANVDKDELIQYLAPRLQAHFNLNI